MAVTQGKSKALRRQHSAISPTRRHRRGTRAKAAISPKRGSRQLFRFREAVGKTVEFVEMATSAEFPCVEIGFTDKTALLFLMEPRLSMEPTFSDWKTGNQRLLLEWPAQETI